ncbi:MAG: hypothetical protein ACOX2B_09340 [Syntrophothermaceae bacterium]
MSEPCWISGVPFPEIGLGRGDDRRALEMFIARNPGTCLVMRENGMLAGTVTGRF